MARLLAFRPFQLATLLRAVWPSTRWPSLIFFSPPSFRSTPPLPAIVLTYCAFMSAGADFRFFWPIVGGNFFSPAAFGKTGGQHRKKAQLGSRFLSSAFRLPLGCDTSCLSKFCFSRVFAFTIFEFFNFFDFCELRLRERAAGQYSQYSREGEPSGGGG
ncbi:hypothetical protein PICMEDRAFT_165221 [Pichia membranifaciens NRRL Y-2026]|uniref:Uncharacterized protein n=1 Tax=Pichia membranifaciens NRRL Y-2026 TaxID=763406 RepID=A0A1E3NFY1_9ASCO|nr:hypothetical protein PICMEDRAFT_165221 [Pichia membranifaciens NRRL Y-2026]ODQ45055.1 hypothetical protein PICMEDRAFT_165221 [Pichia membranifaciens NRRL Y-2026]